MSSTSSIASSSNDKKCSNDSRVFHQSNHQSNAKILNKLGILFMLVECQSPEWVNAKYEKLYVCLHGYHDVTRIATKKETLNAAKRARDGTLIITVQPTLRYTKHQYVYDGFFYNNADADALVPQLQQNNIEVKQLLPYNKFVSYMHLFRGWCQSINTELNKTMNDWYRIDSDSLWVRVYALCIGVSGPYTALTAAQQTEFKDRFNMTRYERNLYGGVSNLMHAGLGLFARRHMKEGTTLGVFKGKWYPREKYNSGAVPNALWWTFDHPKYRETFVPDPHCILNFANDTSKPGTKLLPNNYMKDKGKLDLNAECVLDGLDHRALVLVLLKDVQPGDEIFFSYGKVFWK